MYNYEPLLREVIRATYNQSPQVAARFRPFGLESEREPLPLALPKVGRDHTFGITAPVLDLSRLLISIRETGVAVQARLFPARAAAACPDSACC